MLSSTNRFNPLEIIVVGPSSSGKTNLMTAHACNVNKKFTPHHRPTIGTDFLTARFELGNEESICMRIWDTASPPLMGIFPNKYMEGPPDLYILCMDLSDPYAIFNLEKVIKEYDINGSRKSTHGILLVGTKSDKERAYTDLDSFIDRLKKDGIVIYVETSAKNFADGNVETCFQTAREMLASSPKIAMHNEKYQAPAPALVEATQVEVDNKNEAIKASIVTHSFIGKPKTPEAETTHPLPESKPAPAKTEGLHLVLRLRK